MSEPARRRHHGQRLRSAGDAGRDRRARSSSACAHEVRIVSAHRTPDVMYEYARTAAGRGLQVIIAGAGGAAHLPGMTASMTSLPVIGVPVPLATARRPRLAAVDRADAGRRSRSPRSRSATPRTRACSRCASSARATTSCRAAMEHYQADLARAVRDQGRQARAGALLHLDGRANRRELARSAYSVEIARSTSSRAARRAREDRRDDAEHRREHDDDHELCRSPGSNLVNALIVQRASPRPTRRTDRSRSRAVCRATTMITDSHRIVGRGSAVDSCRPRAAARSRGFVRGSTSARVLAMPMNAMITAKKSST